MAKRIYWLDDKEWARIEPLLPRGRRGARWRDCPAEYGPYTTIYNRFNRWSRQGIWHEIFYALTGHTGIYSSASIDATHVKAHRCAAGAKGGTSSRG
jgi:transposase